MNRFLGTLGSQPAMGHGEGGLDSPCLPGRSQVDWDLSAGQLASRFHHQRVEQLGGSVDHDLWFWKSGSIRTGHLMMGKRL